ncbi:hypothetical protein KY285_023084 [Solanum tuberosum]|nr:hypothetical protein KY285_023084 [Solanum tuberosum]
MERVVNPGPIDRTLLLSQHEHKLELLWKGEISFSSLMRTVRMNDAWNLFRLHRPHGRVKESLRRSRLYDVVCVGRMQYNRALVTAMVERWRPDRLIASTYLLFHDPSLHPGRGRHSRTISGPQANPHPG